MLLLNIAFFVDQVHYGDILRGWCWTPGCGFINYKVTRYDILRPNILRRENQSAMLINRLFERDMCDAYQEIRVPIRVCVLGAVPFIRQSFQFVAAFKIVSPTKL